jgi:hypothetical protein
MANFAWNFSIDMRVGHHCLVQIGQYPWNAQDYVGKCKDLGVVLRELVAIEKNVIRRWDRYLHRQVCIQFLCATDIIVWPIQNSIQYPWDSRGHVRKDQNFIIIYHKIFRLIFMSYIIVWFEQGESLKSLRSCCKVVQQELCYYKENEIRK